MPGYLALVEVDSASSDTPKVRTDGEGNVKAVEGGKKEVLVSWVPDELLNRMDEEDRAGYKRVEGRFNSGQIDAEEDGKLSQIHVTHDRLRLRVFATAKRREVRILCTSIVSV